MKKQLIAAVSALAISLGLDTFASAASPEPSTITPVASPAEDAWLRFHETLKRQREDFLKDPLAKDPIVRAQGLYQLQSMEVVGFNMYIAPRTQYPALYVQSIYMPFEISWGFPTPDYVYHDGFIDGAHTYRIYGNKRQSYWATLQLLKGFWGDEARGDFAFVDFDKIPYAPNGDFEIFLGPNPPAQPDGKYWVKLDPNLHNMFVLLREVFADWNRDKPMDLHIEILDRDPGAPITYGEDELATRIDRASKLTEESLANLKFVYSLFKKDANDGNETMVHNRFIRGDNKQSTKYSANPIACYVGMIYDIKPDEALILDMPPVHAHFWDFQVGSYFMQSADGYYHRGSINTVQARYDADGHVRAVVSLKDPGVPNWLDPVGVPSGIGQLRLYKADSCPEPVVTKVKFADLRKHLPKDTPVVTADQRNAELDARRKVSLYRYGE